MTYAEILFVQAEVTARGWLIGNPGRHCMDVIRASMAQCEEYGPANRPSDAAIEAYLVRPEIAYTGLADIHRQTSIALCMNGMEAWSNWRRTESPELLSGPDLLLNRIPIRFSCPESEQSLNRANLEPAISRQGDGVGLTTPVWWDMN